MGFFRFLKYKYVTNSRKKKYATLAMSIALAHASLATVKYKSLGNGMADITLALQGDNNFQLDFRPSDRPKYQIMKGKWSVEEGNYILHFKKSKIDLNTLFDSNTGFNKISQITDRKTVKFPSAQSGLVIFGIYCPRLSM